MLINNSIDIGKPRFEFFGDVFKLIWRLVVAGSKWEFVLQFTA